MSRDSVRVRVPAKLNLHLGVGARRCDGYHDIVTVFQAVALYDEVHAVPAEELSVTVTGEGAPDLPRDQRNLMWRAASLLAERAGVPPGVGLAVHKGIPVAAGLAGGSADAAATLVACDALWGLGGSRAELAQLAAELGSDVAFALVGGTALGTGRGETLSPLLGSDAEYWWVLAIAEGQLSTAAIYAGLDAERGDDAGELAVPNGLLRALSSGDPAVVADHLHNDLQAVALAHAPYLRNTLRAGAELGALGALVSGSGPTCAFLSADEEAATALAAALSAEGVCRTTRVVAGPVPGARVG